MVRDCTEEEKTRQWTDEDGTVKETYVPKADDPVNDLYKLGISAGINFSAYEKIPVKTSGRNIPEAIDTFSAAKLRPLLLENISSALPWSCHYIHTIVKGDHLLAEKVM